MLFYVVGLCTLTARVDDAERAAERLGGVPAPAPLRRGRGGGLAMMPPAVAAVGQRWPTA
jgi:hypothetical protein